MKKRVLQAALLSFVLAMLMAVGTAADSATAKYGTWDTATVAPLGEAVSIPMDTCNNAVTDGQVWVAVNVEKDNQAIQLALAGLNSDMEISLFRHSDLEAGNFSWNSRLCSWNTASASTYQWKVDTAGVYYLLLKPRYDSDVSEKLPTLICTLVNGDLNENNDTWESATELTENVNAYYNLAGQNDVDWFKITTAVPGEAIKLSFTNFDYTVGDVGAYLYSENDLKNTVWQLNRFSDNFVVNYKVNEPSTYYLAIKTYWNEGYVTKDLKVSYTTVQPDENEINDTWETATPISYAQPHDFTLNGTNDVDWFKFSTSEPNEVVYFYLNGFETDYSNRIQYEIYDLNAEGDGLSNRLYNGTNISMTYSSVRTFANVGDHYIKINRYYNNESVENSLTFRIEKGTTDAYEPNDTYDTAIPMAENVALNFNIPSNMDQDWFCFNTTEPNQTVELNTHIPAGKSVYMRLYSGADFEVQGSGASYWENWYLGQGDSKCRLTLTEPGAYYVCMSFHNNSFEENATISYTLVGPDANERNDYWKNATILNRNVATEYTLPASNDVDWFKFTATEPNQTVELISNVPADSSIRCRLYFGADFEAQGDNAAYWENWYLYSGESRPRFMLGKEGDYYLCVTRWNGWDKDPDASANITFDLIDAEEIERNDTWKTATVLNREVEMEYYLYGSNDVDWFKFTTTMDNQTVELRSKNPEGRSVRIRVYSDADFQEYGDGASYLENWYVHDDGTVRLMLEEQGQYYVCVNRWNGWDNNQDASAVISYSLIDPDANERNNYYTTATELARGETAYFRLPASNDYDYFHIGAMTAGDVLETTFGNMPADGRRQARLYVLTEEHTDLSQAYYYYVPTNGTTKHTWNIETDGDYYLLMQNFDGYTDQTMWLRYAVTAKDKPVTGIESISNGGSTIFVGKTLNLYANVKPSNATNQGVTWSSSNPAVATIDENGLVTGVSVGKTTITACSAENNLYSTSTVIEVVKPVPVTGVTVTANDVAKKGEAQDNPYYLSWKTSIQLYSSILPETATERAVTWSSSNPDVVAVNSYGEIFAEGSGSAVITATTVEGGFTANFYVNVPDESHPVTSISMNYNAATLYMGEGGIDLVASVYPSYATNPAVGWRSDNESVATVDPKTGHVTPVSEGYATIYAYAEENQSITGSCVISVQPVRVRVTGVSFAETEVNVGIYGTTTLLPIITPDTATDQGVTWTTSNKTIATVSRNGEVTALNIGSAVITATTNDGSFTSEITVKVSSTAEVGDLNNDGDVDAGDALLILRSSVGLIKLSEAQAYVADVNGDGDIDAGDAVMILRYDAGLIDSFPAEKK